MKRRPGKPPKILGLSLSPTTKADSYQSYQKHTILEEDYRQLGMKEQYMELDCNPTTHTADMLHNVICKMYLDKQINRSLGEYLDPHNGQMRSGFLHDAESPHDPPPGMFCRKTGGFELFISIRKGFRTQRLLPLTGCKIPPTYIKDTGDNIRKAENIQLPNDIILAGFNVDSMFTSVPQDEAFQTLRNRYW